MKKARKKQYYLATYRAVLTAVLLFALFVLYKLLISAVITETVRACMKQQKQTYSTSLIQPSGDIKVLYLGEQMYIGDF